MSENSTGTYSAEEIPCDTLSEVHKFFEINGSLLYFDDIPENESILQNMLPKSVSGLKNVVDNFVSDEPELADNDSLYTESHKIYCSLRQYTKAKKCNLSNVGECDSYGNNDKNISKTENQPSFINLSDDNNSVCFSRRKKTAEMKSELTSKDKRLHCKSKNKSPEMYELRNRPFAKSNVKIFAECEKGSTVNTVSADGSLSIAAHDPLVSKALKNAALLQPRIFLTNICISSEKNKYNFEPRNNASSPSETLRKKCQFNAEITNEGENSSETSVVSGKVFQKRKRLKTYTEIDTNSSPKSISDDDISLSSSIGEKIIKKRGQSEKSLKKNKAVSTRAQKNPVSLKRKLDREDSVVSFNSKNKIQKENIDIKCKKPHVVLNPLNGNISNMEILSNFEKSENQSKSTTNQKESTGESKLLSSELIDPTSSSASPKKNNSDVSNISSSNRIKLSLMDILKKYSEKSNLEPEISLVNVENTLSENEIDNVKQCVVNLGKRSETDKLTSKRCRTVVSNSSSFLSPLTKILKKDQPQKTLGSVHNNIKRNSVIKSKNLDLNVSTEELPSLCASENTSLIPIHDSHKDCHKEPESSLTSPSKSQAKVSKMVKCKDVSSKSVVFTRMQTRTLTNTVVSVNARDLLNGKLSVKSLTKKSPKSNNKKETINCLFNSNIENVVETENISLLEENPVVQSTPKKRKRTLSSKYISLKPLNKRNSVTDFSSDEHSEKEKEYPCSVSGYVHENDHDEQIVPPNFINTEENIRDSSHSLTSTELNGCQFNIPRIIFNSSDNSQILGDPCVQLPLNTNQNVYSLMNPYAVLQQKPFNVQNFPLNSFPSLPYVTYPLFNSQPIIQQSNVLTSSNLSHNGFIGNGSVMANTALNPFSNLNLSSTLTGVQKVPIIIQSSTSAIHTCTNTETIDSYSFPTKFKGKGFTLIKNIAKSGRKLCVYDICDTALRYFTENESFSKITVKEFYLRSPLTEILQPRIFESPDFDEAPKVEYVFEGFFHESALRDVVKDYVSFHLDAFYKQPASKDYFVKKAFKYFPFRDCSYLCESFPKDGGEFNHKDIILFLSCSALLVILDECMKRNILS